MIKFHNCAQNESLKLSHLGGSIRSEDLFYLVRASDTENSLHNFLLEFNVGTKVTVNYFPRKNGVEDFSFDWDEVGFKKSALDGDYLKNALKTTAKYSGLGVIYCLWLVSQGEVFTDYFYVKKEDSATKKLMDETIKTLKNYTSFPHALYKEFSFYNYKNEEIKMSYSQPIQKIKFGPPGTGKSHSVEQTIYLHCGYEKRRSHQNVITTVFHPDYSYGDFTAKLMPVTVDKKVEYQIHAGPLAKALAWAFCFQDREIYLIIEEINRGNTAAIFGDIFQLLDRDHIGNSEYPIHIQTLFYEAIEQEFKKIKPEASDVLLASILENQRLYIPRNLSFIATMNTSDESVFYMDSAFKRRWHFEYVDVDADSNRYDNLKSDVKSTDSLHPQITAKLSGRDNLEWDSFRRALNAFIKENSSSIRRIEDKLIGLWFIKACDGEVSESEIKNKLMHFLWDSVFSRDKKPLITKIKPTENIVTFGDFIKQYDQFLAAFSPSDNNSSR